MNSFQTLLKVKMPAVTMAGIDSGIDDVPHGLDARAAVDHGGVFHLGGEAAQIAHHEPGAEGHAEGDVGQDQPRVGVEQAQPHDDQIHGDEEQRARNQIDKEHAAGQDGAAREAQPGQRIGGQACDTTITMAVADVATISVLRR